MSPSESAIGGQETDPSRALTYPQPWSAWPDQGWWKKLAAAPRALLMLDFDGTLAPFVEDRLHAEMYSGVAELLLSMADTRRLRLVFISGRQARELLTLLPAGLRPEIWGSHGRERLLPDGEYHLQPLLHEQQQALIELESLLIDRGLEEHLERKPGSVALHTRGMPSDRERQLGEMLEGLYKQIKPVGFSRLTFDGGVEVRAVGRTKGSAVNEILQDEPGSLATAYLGDDHTDEDAFEALHGRGLRVLVRQECRASAADVWLRPPGDLLAFLKLWLAACKANQSEFSS